LGEPDIQSETGRATVFSFHHEVVFYEIVTSNGRVGGPGIPRACHAGARITGRRLRGSIMGFVLGIASGVGLFAAPTIITNIVTATL
jgi:hypothetical protein